MRIVVLGGAGFIGRHVAAALAARGHGVVIAAGGPGAPRGDYLPPCTLASGAKRTSSV